MKNIVALLKVKYSSYSVSINPKQWYRWMEAQMKVKDVMSGVLTVILWIAVLGLFAQQPNIDITLDNSLQIPLSYSFDDMIKLPNGDLQFYKITTSYGSIQVTGFQYLSQSNTLTEAIQIGSITGIQEECATRIRMQRFEKYYAVCVYPVSNPQGLVVLRMDANELEYRIIDDLALGNNFSVLEHIDIVSDNSIVIALEDSLVYYDFAGDTCQTLLEGEDYQIDPIRQWKRVFAIPNGHFMYIKDSSMACESLPETWVIFDSDGNLQFTKTIMDPFFANYVFSISWLSDFHYMNDRFYISLGGIVFDEIVLECHFPSPDSLHFYIIHPPGSLNEIDGKFISFGDDRILRSYFDLEYGNSWLYMNHSPLEQNPEPTHWNTFGPITPQFNNIGDDIVTVSARYEEYMYVSALCTLDFPTPHTFTFPAPPVNVYLPSFSFSHENKLFFVSDRVIYAFSVEYSVSNADPIAVPPIHSISAHPNPVDVKGIITFESSTKQQMDLDIYNIRGQKVSTVKLDSSGRAQWDLRGHKGERISAGLYLAKPRYHKFIKPLKIIATH